MKILITLLSFLLLATNLFAQESEETQDWPQWRGPDGNSVAVTGNYPTKFSATENVLWRTPLPGKGSSTPAVWGDRIFVTSGDDGKDGIQCYDFEGEPVWKKTLGPERPGKHKNGSGSNPSPITDGTNVFVYYKSGTVASLHRRGRTELEN